MSVDIKIATWPRSKHTDKKSLLAYERFIDVSRLFSVERWLTYSLIENPEIHARWLCCDDALLKPDDSFKSAAHKTPFTMTRVESNAANLKVVDDDIANGHPIFDPLTNANHR